MLICYLGITRSVLRWIRVIRGAVGPDLKVQIRQLRRILTHMINARCHAVAEVPDEEVGQPNIIIHWLIDLISIESNISLLNVSKLLRN